MSEDGDCYKTDPVFEEISCPKKCWPMEIQSQCQNIIFFFGNKADSIVIEKYPEFFML